MTLALYLVAGSLKGSLAFIVAGGANKLLEGRMQARWRRLWWLLVPVAFLAPMTLPLPIGGPGLHLPVGADQNIPFFPSESLPDEPAGTPPPVTLPWLFLVWLGGALLSGSSVIVSTYRTHRRWSRVRFSSDPALVELLEDSKALAGVTAPMGLIVLDSIPVPALLGWLRPRLLLPATIAGTSSPFELKAIFLHELAHFKMGDLPLNWLFSLVRTLHWFNPFAYLACAAWARFREEAADEKAIGWLDGATAFSYGEVLLQTLGKCSGGAPPRGALAIGESIETLKKRMLMIRTYSSKSAQGWLAGTVALLLAALTICSPARAQTGDPATAKQAAEAAMQLWLAEIDAGHFAQSWKDAAASFQTALSSDKWVGALDSVRTPLGKLESRKLVSSLYQTSIPTPSGELLQGKFVIAQFDSSFENLNQAVETVCFEQGSDGTWKASGYYVKPKL